jgi:Tfp pilus assembly protein PilN
MRPLNLASQPFRNERMPVLLLGVAAIAVLALTLQHALILSELLPAKTSGARKEAAALDAESARLRAEARSLSAPRAEPAGMAQWGLIKDLVDRRAFSWTLLFAHLESVLPYGVRLISIAPSVRKGEVLLDVAAEARRPEDAREFVRRLEGREEFDDVYLREEGDSGEVRFTMKYRPTGRSLPTKPTPAEAGASPVVPGTSAMTGSVLP